MATVGHALVGRRIEPEESDQSLWNHRHYFLCDLLGTDFIRCENMMRQILLIAVVLLAAAGCAKEKPTENVVNAVPSARNEMPPLVTTQTDNSKVSLKDLKGKVMIVFFNPDCDHCQREAKLISQNKDVFSSYQVYFITPDQMPVIEKFAVDYDLLDSNFHFCRSEPADIFNAVGAITSLPTFFVFNDQILVGKNEGETTIENLRTLLK
jgi:peroxiredoxin